MDTKIEFKIGLPHARFRHLIDYLKNKGAGFAISYDYEKLECKLVGSITKRDRFWRFNGTIVCGNIVSDLIRVI